MADVTGCDGLDTFACDADNITLVSLAIALGAVSLAFVYFLMQKVRLVFFAYIHVACL